MKTNETFDENGNRHSYNDEPAYFEENFTQLWYNHGVLHREKDFPAKVLKNSKTLEWYSNGVRHRENQQPALIRDDKPVFYGIFGGGHRLDGPAYATLPNWRFLYAHPLQIEDHKEVLQESKKTGLSLPLLVLGRVYNVDNAVLKNIADLPFIWANKAASLEHESMFDSDTTKKTLECLKLAWATHNTNLLK